MSVTAAESIRAPRLLGLNVETLLVAAIVAIFAVRLYFVFALEINWDEFLFLSRVHEFDRAELTRVLQTLHVNFFRWLVLVSENEVDQVVAARLAMFTLSLATATLLYGIYRVFLSRRGALFALLCYVTFSFIVQHGESFRADGIVTFILVAALYLVLLKHTFAAAAVAGILIGLAGMVSIKSALYLPTIAAIMLGLMAIAADRFRALARGLVAGGAAVTTFVALYLLHGFSIVPEQAVAAGGVVAHAYERAIQSPGFFPQWQIFAHAAITNAVAVFSLIAGLGIALVRLVEARGERQVRVLMMLALAAPLATLLFYRNSFPYYYVFMLAPACVLCGMVVDALPWQAARERASGIFAALLIALLATASANTAKLAFRGETIQRATLDAIHRMFPDPVAYIDRCSMVAAFPKAGLFMSSWGMANYYDAGEPIMRKTIAATQPRFLLANIEALDLDAQSTARAGRDYYRLFAADIATLKANFVHHWGVIYVAGKTFELANADSWKAFDILIAGEYVLEGFGTVEIDGATVRPGDRIVLAAGAHRVRAADDPGTYILRWAEAGAVPSTAAPDAPVFHGF